jgi:phage terminase Nu1 subunit (DNA packaging protein)
LPSFRILDELAGEIRRKVNQELYQQVYKQLSKEQIDTLNELILRSENQHYSDYNRLKTLPKKPMLKKLQKHIDYYSWLQSHGSMTPFLKGIAPSKVQ